VHEDEETIDYGFLIHWEDTQKTVKYECQL